MKLVTILCIVLSCLFSVRVFSNDVDNLDAIIHQLKNGENSSDRNEAARKLRKELFQGNQKAQEALSEQLEVESDRITREYIARAIVKNGGDAGLDKLIQVANNEQSPARIAALTALDDSDSHKKVVPVLIKALSDENSNIRLEAARGLDSRSKEDSVFPALAAHIKTEDGSLAQEYVARGIAKSDHKYALKVLVEALAHPSSGSKEYAASALGTMNSKEAIDPLIQATKLEDNYTVLAAVRSLGEYTKDDPKVVKRLMEIYESFDDSLIKEYALRGLIKSEDAEALKYARHLLDLPENNILQNYAVDLMKLHGEVHDIKLLAPLLKAESSNKRKKAYEAITAIMKKHMLDQEQAQNLVACLPTTQSRPYGDGTVGAVFLIDVFLFAGLSGLTQEAATAKTIEVPQADDEMVQSIIDFIDSLPPTKES